jgi:UDP-glucose 4-epimerase
MWLVTGGAGFIGSHLTRHLVSQGERVRVLDNFSSGNAARLEDLRGKIEIINGSVGDADLVQRAMTDVRFVLHQAAQASVPVSINDPVGTYQANTMGTLNVLNSARLGGVQRVVMASTSAIYGNNPTSPKRESLAPEPISPYASSKLATESMGEVFTEAYGLPCVMLRYFNVYGPGQDPDSAYAAAIPKFLDKMVRGERPVIFGDGGQTRDFIFVQDVVRANMLAMESAEAVGHVYNIASGESVTILEIVQAIAEHLGIDPNPEFLPERVGDVRDSLADISRAADDLGFQAETDLADGLALTIESVAMASAA